MSFLKVGKKSSSGSKPEVAFDLARIKSYFESKDSTSSFQVLSEQTCQDLDLDRFFETMNHTSSCVGQQYLYDRLRCIPHESEVKKHEKILTWSEDNIILTDKYRKLLSNLTNSNTYYICSLFQKEHIIKSGVFLRTIKILQFLPAVFTCLFITFSTPVWFFLALLFFLVNMILHYKNKQILFLYMYSIPQYLKLIFTAKKLSNESVFESINPNIKQQLKSVSALNHRLAFFRFDFRIESDVSAFIWLINEFIRVFFLLEPNILYNSFILLNNKKTDIESVFSFIGCVDFLLSMSKLKHAIPYYCEPRWVDNDFQLNSVYHPLVESCISNSIDSKGKSILLTGSNMSGKTTFIRAIAMNMISAQTLNLCFAHQFLAVRMKVHTAINLNDNLAESTSLYMKEVLTVKEMLDESQNDEKNLFILDELFKGTNTRERIAAGKAVLSSLAANGNLVFASTHDLELADLLADEYQLYHFCEQIDDNQFYFDYQLKKGKLKNRNAIRLLEIKNYPARVIEEANNIAEKLSN